MVPSLIGASKAKQSKAKQSKAPALDDRTVDCQYDSGRCASRCRVYPMRNASQPPCAGHCTARRSGSALHSAAATLCLPACLPACRFESAAADGSCEQQAAGSAAAAALLGALEEEHKLQLDGVADHRGPSLHARTHARTHAQRTASTALHAGPGRAGGGGGGE